MRKIITLLSFCFYFSVGTFAATNACTATGGGTWATAIWSLGHIPNNTEDAIINSGINLTVDANATCASLTIGDATSAATTLTLSGGNLSITTAGGGSGNLIFNPSSVAQNFTLAIGAQTLTINGFVTFATVSVSSITVSTGSATFANQVTLTSTGTFAFTGTGSATFNGGLTTDGLAITTVAGCSLTVANNLSQGGINGIFLDYGSYIYFNGTTVTLNSGVSFGYVQINSGATLVLNGVTSIAGDLICNQSNGLSANGSTVVLNGISNTIGGTGSMNFADIQLGNSASYNMSNSNTCANLTIGSPGASVNQPSLTIQSGGSLISTGTVTLSQPRFANRTTSFNVNGGNATLSALTFAVHTTPDVPTKVCKVSVSTGTLIINGAITFMAGNNLNVATEVFSVTGAGTMIFNSDLTLGSGSGTLDISGPGTMTFNGNTTTSLTFGGASISPVFNTVSGCTLNFAKGFSNNTNALTFDPGSTASFTSSGSITPSAAISFGNVSISSGTTLSASGDISVTGNWTCNGGTFSDLPYNTTFSGTGPQVINGTSASQVFFGFIVNKTAGTSLTVGGSTTTLSCGNYTNIQGNFTAPATFNLNQSSSASVILNGGTFTAGANINLKRDWTNNGGTFVAGTGKVSFIVTPTIPNSIGGTALSETFYDIESNKNSSVAGIGMLAGSSMVTINCHNFTLTHGRFNMTGLTTFNVSGDVLLTAGVLDLPTNTNLQGNWTNNGVTINNNNGTLNFTGTGTKTLGGTGSSTFYNLSLNTSLNTDVVQLGINETISNILTLTTGGLSMNSNTLIISNSATSAIARTNGYIISESTNNSSKLQWNIGSTTGAHIIPFGTAGGSFIPLTFNLNSGDDGNLTVSTYPTAANNTPYPTGVSQCGNRNDNSANVVDRFWQIDVSNPAGGANADLTFVAAAAEIGGITNMRVEHWNTGLGQWDSPLVGVTNTGNANGATVTGITSFSPWTLSGNGHALPIQLLNFNAIPNSNKVYVNWSTATETNNDYFNVERSANGIDFTTINTTYGAGISSVKLNYSTIDYTPLQGQSYYRLKQTDYDGKFTYSQITPVDRNTITSFDINMFPNPIRNQNDNVVITLSGTDNNSSVLVVLRDMLGQEHYSKVIMGGTDGTKFIFDSFDKLSTGIYIITASSKDKLVSKKIIVE